MNPTTPARLRLDRALGSLDDTFRGMTARADEVQCDCHWGSPEELALLKTPDVGLSPDLLRRTRDAPTGPTTRLCCAGSCPGSPGPWWVATAVWEFLHAWWARSLLDPAPAAPVHEILALCGEASTTLGPWLTV